MLYTLCGRFALSNEDEVVDILNRKPLDKISLIRKNEILESYDNDLDLVKRQAKPHNELARVLKMLSFYELMKYKYYR